MTIDIPDNQMIREALLQGVLPPAATVLVVLGLGMLIFGKAAAGWLSVVAVVLGWWVGNFFREVVLFSPVEMEWTTKLGLKGGNGKRIEWLPWLMTCTGIAALFFKRFPGVGWALWLTAIAFAIPRIVPNIYLVEPWWAMPAFVLAATLAGVLLQHRHSQSPGWLLPGAVWFATNTVGAIALYAHSARIMDAAILLASGWIVVAFLALCTGADVGRAIAPTSFALVGLSLIGFHETSSEMPWTGFALPVIGLVAAALVPLEGRRGTGVRVALIVGSCIAAMAIAHFTPAEPPPF
jgi:hypothetical protein